MTSDSVASFRSFAQAQSILSPNQLELFNQPDAPRENVLALCDFLHKRGVLTPYQTEQIRNGSLHKLSFAGYPIQAERGLCPGGMEFAALHPSLRTPVLLRQIPSQWVRPLQSLLDYVSHAQAVAPLTHDNLANLLDARIVNDTACIVMEPFEGANLDELVRDIGAMPTSLAVEYARHMVAGLQAVHQRGWVHSEVMPEHVRVGPLVPMAKLNADGSPRMRPSATSTVKLFELGLVPTRPPLLHWVDFPQAKPGRFHYLAPERVDDGSMTQPGDIYSLAASIYYLLTGHPPFPNVEGYELLDAMRVTATASLRELRPDVPIKLTTLIEEMMQTDPAKRPAIDEVQARLQPFTKLGQPVSETVPPKADTPDAPDLSPKAELQEAPSESVPTKSQTVPTQFPMPQETWPTASPEPTLPMEAPAWSGDTATKSAEDYTATPRSPRPIVNEPKSNVYLWIAVGAALNLIALALLIYMLV